MSRFTILHSHESGSNFWARVLGRAWGVPVVVTHDHTAATEKGALKSLADRALQRWSDHILTVSEFDRKRAIEVENLEPARVSAVYNGIDAMSFASPLTPEAARRAAGLPATGRLIAVVARLVPQKNHIGLFQAIAALPPSLRHNLHCLLIGDGYLERALRERAERLGNRKPDLFLGAA